MDLWQAGDITKDQVSSALDDCFQYGSNLFDLRITDVQYTSSKEPCKQKSQSPNLGNPNSPATHSTPECTTNFERPVPYSIHERPDYNLSELQPQCQTHDLPPPCQTSEVSTMAHALGPQITCTSEQTDSSTSEDSLATESRNIFVNRCHDSEGRALLYLNTRIPDPLLRCTGYYVGLPDHYPSYIANGIREATESELDENLLIWYLTKVPPVLMPALDHCFKSKFGTKMLDVLQSATQGLFRMGICALYMGPLMFDVDLVHFALADLSLSTTKLNKNSTDELLLQEIILGRSKNELKLLKDAYQYWFQENLICVIKNHSSLKAKRVVLMALRAGHSQESIPLDSSGVQSDVDALQKALSTEKRARDPEKTILDILINRSVAHLTAVIEDYKRQHMHTLSAAIKKKFSGKLELRSGLLYLVAGAKQKHPCPAIWRDAKLIDRVSESSTQCRQFLLRIVRAHWEAGRMKEIKEAYKQCKKVDLASQVQKVTKGSCRDLVLALINDGESEL